MKILLTTEVDLTLEDVLQFVPRKYREEAVQKAARWVSEGRPAERIERLRLNQEHAEVHLHRGAKSSDALTSNEEELLNELNAELERGGLIAHD